MPRQEERQNARGESCEAERGEALAQAWQALAKAHPDHPALRDEVIYALPAELLDAMAIEGRQLFSADEERFERDLSRLGGAGFFLQKPIRYPLLGLVPVSKNEELEARQVRSKKAIEELWINELRRSGRSEQDLAEYAEAQADVRQRVEERRLGYAGWLTTTNMSAWEIW